MRIHRNKQEEIKSVFRGLPSRFYLDREKQQKKARKLFGIAKKYPGKYLLHEKEIHFLQYAYTKKIPF